MMYIHIFKHQQNQEKFSGFFLRFLHVSLSIYFSISSSLSLYSVPLKGSWNSLFRSLAQAFFSVNTFSSFELFRVFFHFEVVILSSSYLYASHEIVLLSSSKYERWTEFSLDEFGAVNFRKRNRERCNRIGLVEMAGLETEIEIEMQHITGYRCVFGKITRTYRGKYKYR